MTGSPYPLSVARAVAVRTLDELGAERPGWRPNPDFWMNLLAESLRQMVDATAADRVIDVAPLPVPSAAAVALCATSHPTDGWLCTLTAGHDGEHSAPWRGELLVHWQEHGAAVTP